MERPVVAQQEFEHRASPLCCHTGGCGSALDCVPRTAAAGPRPPECWLADAPSQPSVPVGAAAASTRQLTASTSVSSKVKSVSCASEVRTGGLRNLKACSTALHTRAALCGVRCVPVAGCCPLFREWHLGAAATPKRQTTGRASLLVPQGLHSPHSQPSCGHHQRSSSTGHRSP